MPEPKAPQTIAAQYDIGAPGQDDAPEVIETPAPDDRARGPDGKFLPKETVHNHPSYQARRARDLGMSDAEIAATSPEVLDHIIYQATEQWRLNAMQRELDRKPQEAPVVAPEESVIDDEGSIHPGLLKLMKDQQKTIAEMQKQLESVRNEGRQRHLETLEEKVDRVFEEAPELFGAGRGRDMDRESAEFAKRLAVIHLADKIKTGSTEQKLRVARAKLFGKPEAKPETKPAAKPGDLTSQQAAWNEAAVHAPTARKAALESMPFGVERAKRAVRAEMQGQTTNGEAGSETTLDEFPG